VTGCRYAYETGTARNAWLQAPVIYDAVWVTGTLRTQLKNSRFGMAGYTLEGTKVEPYEFQPR
jgi:hypothetical protein